MSYSIDTEDFLQWVTRIGYGELSDALRDDAMYMKNGKLSVRRVSRRLDCCDSTVHKQLAIIRQMWDDKLNKA